MMRLGWAAAALLAPAGPAVEAPSLAAWHGSWVGEGEAFGKPATATLEIAPGEGGATMLSYRLSIERTPPVAYSAEATYAVDAKGRVGGKWTDSTGRTRAVAGGVNAAKWWTHLGQRRCRDRPIDLCPRREWAAPRQRFGPAGRWRLARLRCAALYAQKPLKAATFQAGACCAQKKRAGTCVPAQPFRLSPPETVDPMNAILMSCWKG